MRDTMMRQWGENGKTRLCTHEGRGREESDDDKMRRYRELKYIQYGLYQLIRYSTIRSAAFRVKRQKDKRELKQVRAKRGHDAYDTWGLLLMYHTQRVGRVLVSIKGIG